MSPPRYVPGKSALSRPLSRETEADRQVILDQLDRVLASPLFRHSKRCGPLLKYVVLETLEGRAESLKERAIGIAVFGRKPTYDTNEDPVVRTAAVEVRKRIAQYYHEIGHESEIWIDLTSGSYIPHFQLPPAQAVVPEPDRAGAIPEPPGPEHNGELPVPAQPARRILTRRVMMLSAVVLAGVLAVAAVLTWVGPTETRDPVRAFWAPLLRSGTVTLAMGDLADSVPRSVEATQDTGTPAEPTFIDKIRADRVGFVDGVTMARVAVLVASGGTRLEYRREGSLTLQDLRRGPAILIGENNSPWTGVLESQLRYRFTWDSKVTIAHLEDQQDPGHPLWQMQSSLPVSRIKEDRAIVSRFLDPRTEQPVLLVAGFGSYGTEAAGQFVTERKYLELLASRAPKGWSRKNLQIVLATDLIGGHPTPPRIVATHFW